MSFLLDTNVLSELRKGGRCHPAVARWAAGSRSDRLYTSVLVVGEIRRGVERLRPRDQAQAAVLQRWLAQLRHSFAGRILSIDEDVAEAWGRLDAPQPMPVTDGLLAATALVHGLTLVTRNVADVSRAGVPELDPFAAA